VVAKPCSSPHQPSVSRLSPPLLLRKECDSLLIHLCVIHIDRPLLRARTAALKSSSREHDRHTPTA